MTYLDVFFHIFGDGHLKKPAQYVLAWSIDFETAVFEIRERVHPKTAWIWFEWNVRRLRPDGVPKEGPTIYKIELSHKKIWRLAEPRSYGKVPLANSSPPFSGVPSVFPQNQR